MGAPVASAPAPWNQAALSKLQQADVNSLSPYLRFRRAEQNPWQLDLLKTSDHRWMGFSRLDGDHASVPVDFSQGNLEEISNVTGVNPAEYLRAARMLVNPPKTDGFGGIPGRKLSGGIPGQKNKKSPFHEQLEKLFPKVEFAKNLPSTNSWRSSFRR